MIDIIELMAKAGDIEAKEVLYRLYAELRDWIYHRSTAPILELDGIGGLMSLLAITPASKLDHPVVREIVIEAKELIGEELVSAALLGTRFEQLLAEPVQVKRSPQPSRPETFPWLLARIADYLEQGKNARMLARRWSFNAVQSEMQSALDALADTTDQDFLNALSGLRPKSTHKFDISRLIERAKDASDAELDCLVDVMSFAKDKAVRELSLELFSQGRSIEAATDLLVRNFQPEDAEVICASLPELSSDQLDIHCFTMALIRILEAHKPPKLVPALLYSYENGECSFCRTRIVEVLIELGGCPSEILDECLFDAEPDIRELARAATNSAASL